MSSNKTAPSCSFCGKTQNQIKTLIAGPKVYICDECVSISNSVLLDIPISTQSQNKAKDKKKAAPMPSEIKAHLDKHVIGQDTAKELLSVSAYNHYKKNCCQHVC